MFQIDRGCAGRVRLAALAVGLAATPALGAETGTPFAPEVRESIRMQLESASDPAGLFVRGEPVHALTATPSFYELRGYRPAWLKDGRLRPAANDLVRVIRESEREGLAPRDYHVEALAPLLLSTEPRGGGADSERLAAADIYAGENPRDGVMDGLNRDGVVDRRDAEWLYDLIDSHAGREPYEPFLGGLGAYGSTAAHGPFVHVDVRGFKARWGR